MHVSTIMGWETGASMYARRPYNAEPIGEGAAYRTTTNVASVALGCKVAVARDNLGDKDLPGFSEEAGAEEVYFLDRRGRERICSLGIPKELGSFAAEDWEKSVLDFSGELDAGCGSFIFAIDEMFRLLVSGI